MIGFKAGSGHPQAQQRPAGASPRESLTSAWHAFTNWRRTRPFWGGLFVIVGAGEMLASEQAPVSAIAQIGFRGLAAYLTPIFILICGLLLWLSSIARTYHSLLAILLASYSWVTSNLGGFFIGMTLSVIGGALAFAWMTDADYKSSEAPSGRLHIRLASLAFGVVPLLKERAQRARASVKARTRLRLELHLPSRQFPIDQFHVILERSFRSRQKPGS